MWQHWRNDTLLQCKVVSVQLCISVHLLSPQNNTQSLMSKPLVTKVSTPLSENVQIGPKVSIFCVATKVKPSQVATEVLFHSSMMTSMSWWMLETLCSSTFCLRMPHRCSIGFRSGYMLGQSITFTLSFFSNAMVIIMLEYCPAAQSLKGGDHALLQYCTVHVGIHGYLNEL